ILDRGPEEYYTSAAYQAVEKSRLKFIAWEGEIPPKTWVKVAVRIAGSVQELENADWSRWFKCGQNINMDMHPGACMQYKLALGAVNSLRSPRITKVIVCLVAVLQTQYADSWSIKKAAGKKKSYIQREELGVQ
ncbi:MAG: hypothetical protein PHV59_13120, partial [Victivallales bacterium]|nr:hypothetical protein [Victivallales bacterium]